MVAKVSLEEEIRRYFEGQGMEFDDRSHSFVQLDFGFGDLFQNRYFVFDAKEKRQPYNPRNWPTAIPEPHLFILDDLAARKILLHAPNAGLVVRDTPNQRYVFFSVVDLFLMPKQRVNRPIHRREGASKGKWLVDLRNGQASPHLPGVFTAIQAYLDQREAIFHRILTCYGEYQGEAIGSGGTVRRPDHWEQDVGATR